MTKNNNVKGSVAISKRISAYLIDILIVFVIFSLTSEIKFINPNYDKYIETYELYSEIVDDYTHGLITEDEMIKLNSENYYYICKYSLSYNIVIVLGLVLYFGVFQKYNNGQTVGKKLMKIKVVCNSTNENPSMIKYILRIVPMYYIYIGGMIPLIINTILLYVLNKNNYMNITNTISCIFLLVSFVSFIMINIRKDKRGLQDLISNTNVIYEER